MLAEETWMMIDLCWKISHNDGVCWPQPWTQPVTHQFNTHSLSSVTQQCFTVNSLVQY